VRRGGLAIGMLVTLLFMSPVGCATFRQQPETFDINDANWSGQWRSKRYVGISGMFYVKFPDPIPQGEEFEVTGAVLFDNSGGGFLPERFELQYTALVDPAHGLQAVDSRGKSLRDERSDFTMRGGPIGTDLNIVYAAEFDQDGLELKGRYSADRPYDAGNFSLSRLIRERTKNETPGDLPAVSAPPSPLSKK
jgi:hypothetical protein